MKGNNIMKKALVLILAGLIALSAAACGDNTDTDSKNESSVVVNESSESVVSETESKEESTEESKEESTATEEKVTDPLKVLTDVWGKYEEDNKFAIIGGDFSEDNLTDNAPGVFHLVAEDLQNQLLLPSAHFESIDSAASMCHMMNANTFTAGAYHLKDGVDAKALAQAILEAIQQNHWMCGIPEKCVVISVGDCMVSAFGHSEFIDYFRDKVVEVYPSAEILHDEPIE